MRNYSVTPNKKEKIERYGLYYEETTKDSESSSDKKK